jgi:hypothetical protein
MEPSAVDPRYGGVGTGKLYFLFSLAPAMASRKQKELEASSMGEAGKRVFPYIPYPYPSLDG